MIGFNGPIISPVYMRILELARPIEAPEEDTTIKLNGLTRIYVCGRFIKIIGPIKTLKCIEFSSSCFEHFRGIVLGVQYDLS